MAQSSVTSEILSPSGGAGGTLAVLHTEASPGWGGQEIRILEETGRLLARGHRVLIACQPQSRILVEARKKGLECQAVRMRGSFDPLAMGALRRIIRQDKIDIVHTHSSIDSWLALGAKFLGFPVVRSRHVSIPVHKDPVRTFVYRHISDVIITSGETIRQMVLASTGVSPEKVVSIPAGVDLQKFRPDNSGESVRAEFGIGPSAPLVGMVGMLRGSKGHEFFVRAAEKVLVKAPEARFLVVGDGSRREGVTRLVRELGLQQKVILTGYRKDIPEVMAALDILVLASVRTEATSQVIPQAYATGKPVVATQVGGVAEVVTPGATGVLVPPRDVGALAQGVLTLLEDSDLARRMGEAGRKFAEQHLSIEKMMAATEAVYRNLLAQRNPKKPLS